MSRKQKILRWAFVLIFFVLGLFSCLHLKINDDAIDLLPGEAVRGDIRLLQKMGLVDRLFITLSVSDSLWQDRQAADTLLRKSVEELGNRLEASKQFSFVLARLPKGYELSLFGSLRNSLPLLFGPDDLQGLEQLVSEEGVKSSLQKSFALLNSPAGIALKKQIQMDPLGMVPQVLEKLKYLQTDFSLTIDDGFFISQDGRHCLIVAESHKSLTDSEGAVEIWQIVKDGYSRSLSQGIEARIIGSLPHTLANKRIIEHDLKLLLPAATILLGLLLAFSLRNIRALVVLGVPFLAAPLAIGMTSLFYSNLSGLALGFGIVLLGIAVDFSIHLYLVLTSGEGSRQEGLKRIKRPILYATLTTSAVFLVLLFSEVNSHRQMATLALFGVLLAVVFSWLLIPTIIPCQPPKKMVSVTQLPLSRMGRYPRLLLACWGLLIVAGLLSWPRLHYTGDLRVLDVPDKQVKADSKHFKEIWGESGDQAFIVAKGKSLGQLLDLNSKVYQLLKGNDFEKFQSFAPILPGPALQGQNRANWDTFWATERADFERRFKAESVGMGFTEAAFQPFFSWLDGPVAPLKPEVFFQGTLQPLFRSMLKIPNQSDPQPGQEYLAMTTVSMEEGSLEKLLKLEDEPTVQDESGESGVFVLANSKWSSEVERLLRHDILTLSLLAGCAIVLLVGAQFRNGRGVLAVLAPVFSALSAMSLFCYLTDGQLNMMHLIMGIMVIGLSVDYGIFIVCSKLSGHHSSSAKAVSICAASSLIGFGVLAFAQHPALHSLGITVLVGIGVAWPTALLVSPLILNAKSEQRGAGIQ